jgi:HlyD family secretion protein
MRKRNIFIVLILALAGVAGYLFYTNNANTATAATTPGQIVTVSRGNLLATVASAGLVASASQVALSFGSAGTVKQVFVKLGDQVKKGQVLAELDSTDLQFSLANSQLALNQQQIKFDQVKAGPTAADLATAQLNVDTAQANYDTAARKAGLNDQQLLIYRNSLDKSALALQKAQSDYNIAVSNHITELSVLSTALQQAKLDYASAQANYNIQVANIDDSAVRSAASAVSSAKAALLTLQGTPTQASLDAAQASLDQSKLSLQQAQYNMRNAQLTAPFDGTVTQVNVVTAVSSSSGGSSASTAIQVTDLGNLQVSVNMAEVDVSKIKLGQDVALTLDALSGVNLSGKVSQIAYVATTTSGVVNYPVIISLPNATESGVKVGMTANVAITVDQRQGVLLVPNRAIKTQGQKKVVQVQSGTSVTTRVVTVGLANDNQTEILTGLNEGDGVVIGTTTATTTTGGGGAGNIFGPGAGPGF